MRCHGVKTVSGFRPSNFRKVNMEFFSVEGLIDESLQDL